MQNNMAKAGLASRPSDYVGPLDILIVSPESKEPWYIYFLKNQITKDSAFPVMKKFIKEYRRVGSDSRWAFTFDRKDRWHSVRPAALHRTDPIPSLDAGRRPCCLADQRRRHSQRPQAGRIPRRRRDEGRLPRSRVRQDPLLQGQSLWRPHHQGRGDHQLGELGAGWRRNRLGRRRAARFGGRLPGVRGGHAGQRTGRRRSNPAARDRVGWQAQVARS